MLADGGSVLDGVSDRFVSAVGCDLYTTVLG